MGAEGRARTFSDRVLALVISNLFLTGFGVVNGILLAGLLGPAGKGEYYLVVLLPTTIMVLMQLGLPNALGFYSARGQTRGLVAGALLVGGCLSAVALALTLSVLPILQQTFMRGPQAELIVLGMLVLPFALTSTFLTAIVLGRQAVRWSIAANAASAIASTVLLVVLVGFVRLGVIGAVLALLSSRAMQFIGFLIGAKRVSAVPLEPRRVAFRTLFRYGLPLYPGSVTLFFGYRFDVYLLAWLLVEPSIQLGFYSMAVSMSEMALMVPNAVMTLFFPHVAGSERQDSDRQLGMTSRVTLIMTALAAVVLLPASLALVVVVLPAFGPMLPTLFVLLVSVVGLAVGKVTSAYLLGIGVNSVSSAINISAFVLNVAVNLVLIPRYGILGAAAASLITYAAAAVAFTRIAGRRAGVSMRDLWLPRPDDVRFIIATGRDLIRRVRLVAIKPRDA